MKEIVYKKKARERVLSAVDMLAEPVKQTLSPRGGNVLYQDDKGDHILTNDGITIARRVESEDSVQEAVIDVVRESALRTNTEAGDGTTTSIMFSQTLIHEGMKLIESGQHPRIVRENYKSMGEKIVRAIKKEVIQIKGDSDMENVASISSNNDPVIAKNVARTIKIAGLDGMVFIEPHSEETTELVEEQGFKIDSGIPFPELLQEQGKFSVTYQDVPVLLTDKRIYYKEEAETILRTAVKAGYKSIVVVARDFMGDSVNTFVANHTKGIISVLLIKDSQISDVSNVTLQDLAIYLGGEVISDKTGNLVDKITEKDFVIAEKVFSDPKKSLFTYKSPDKKALNARIEAIKNEQKDDKDNQDLKKRLSSLTSGIVTIKVGGNTPVEIREKIFRYEDAINATRAAVKDGYLVGGGITMLNMLSEVSVEDEYKPVLKKLCEASIRQIAKNCGKHEETVLEAIKGKKLKYWGYNALLDKYEDLLTVGVIDPYKVTELAVLNAISVANTILSINYYIVNEKEDDKENKG